MVEVADVKGASTGVLAELLASASRELLRTVCHPPTDAAGAAAHDARTAVTCSALQRLLASQREAVKQCGDQQAAIAAAGFVDAVAQRQAILDGLIAKLEEAASGMADSIERNTPSEVPDQCAGPPDIASVERTLALAHRLSYTSFAPPGFQPGITPLGNFRPPAPQDAQMRAAQLHQFAAEQEQAALKRQGQLPTALAEQPTTPAVPEATPALLASIPRMPAGWKPGDALPGAETAANAAAAAAPSPAPPKAATVAETVKPQRPVLDASFLVLNPDLEDEAVEEDYSSEEFSDSD